MDDLIKAGSHLLATVAWQIEDQHREKRDTHTRYYKIDGVKQSLPSHGDVERDVEVGLVATRVKFFISANEIAICDSLKEQKQQRIFVQISFRPISRGSSRVGEKEKCRESKKFKTFNLYASENLFDPLNACSQYGMIFYPVFQSLCGLNWTLKSE